MPEPTVSPELMEAMNLETIQTHAKEAIKNLNLEAAKISKEIGGFKAELVRLKNEKSDLEAEIDKKRDEKAALETDIATQRKRLVSDAEAFSAQQEQVGAKADARVMAAEQAEKKARVAEQASQKALSDHLSTVTETHDEAVMHIGQSISLLESLKKKATPEGQQRDQAPEPEAPTD